MKKYILILFSIISFWSCTEDESIDITGLPSVTTTGANTFGCLMDGWIYVGGRYLNWGRSYVWTYDSFHYYTNFKTVFSDSPSADFPLSYAGFPAISTNPQSLLLLLFFLNLLLLFYPSFY